MTTTMNGVSDIPRLDMVMRGVGSSMLSTRLLIERLIRETYQIPAEYLDRDWECPEDYTEWSE